MTSVPISTSSSPVSLGMVRWRCFDFGEKSVRTCWKSYPVPSVVFAACPPPVMSAVSSPAPLSAGASSR